MKSRAIAVLCLQETRIPWSGTRIVDNGYTLITAGHDKDERSFAGVGFLIAPWLKQSVFSFKPVSDRLCCLKLRARGGKAAIICAYAPHNGHEYNIRQSFFADLAKLVDATSVHGSKIVLGDFNARIHNGAGGEDQVFGPYCFGDPSYNPQIHPDANRELLLEFCIARQLCVANTFLQNEAERQITFHDLWQSPVGEITHRGFAQLDLALCSRNALWQLKQVRSDRWQALASHHFLLEVVVETEVSIGEKKDTRCDAKRDLTSLQNHQVRQQFATRANLLANQIETRGTNRDQSLEAYCEALHQAAKDTLPAITAMRKRPWIKPHTGDDREQERSTPKWRQGVGKGAKQANPETSPERPGALARRPYSSW